MKRRILFVCMGNICRSPTAEYVFRKMAEARGRGDEFETESRGTLHWGGVRKADRRSIAVARSRGYDLEPHQARGVQEEDFADFDLIYAMDRSNLQDLKEECPREHRHKLALFLELAPELGVDEVPDPYQGEAGFERVLDLIETACAALLDGRARPPAGGPLS